MDSDDDPASDDNKALLQTAGRHHRRLPRRQRDAKAAAQQRQKASSTAQLDSELSASSSSAAARRSRCCCDGGGLFAGAALASAVCGLTLAMPGPTLLALEKATRSREDQVALLFAGRAVGGLGGALLGRFLAEFFSPRVLMAAGLAGAGIGSFLVLLCSKIWSLMPAFAVQGFGLLLCLSAATAIFRHNCTGTGLPRRLFLASTALGMLLAPLAALSCGGGSSSSDLSGLGNATLLHQHKDIPTASLLLSRSGRVAIHAAKSGTASLPHLSTRGPSVLDAASIEASQPPSSQQPSSTAASSWSSEPTLQSVPAEASLASTPSLPPSSTEKPSPLPPPEPPKSKKPVLADGKHLDQSSQSADGSKHGTGVKMSKEKQRVNSIPNKQPGGNAGKNGATSSATGQHASTTQRPLSNSSTTASALEARNVTAAERNTTSSAMHGFNESQATASTASGSNGTLIRANTTAQSATPASNTTLSMLTKLESTAVPASSSAAFTHPTYNPARNDSTRVTTKMASNALPTSLSAETSNSTISATKSGIANTATSVLPSSTESTSKLTTPRSTESKATPILPSSTASTPVIPTSPSSSAPKSTVASVHPPTSTGGLPHPRTTATPALTKASASSSTTQPQTTPKALITTSTASVALAYWRGLSALQSLYVLLGCLSVAAALLLAGCTCCCPAYQFPGGDKATSLPVSMAADHVIMRVCLFVAGFCLHGLEVTLAGYLFSYCVRYLSLTVQSGLLITALLYLGLLLTRLLTLCCCCCRCLRGGAAIQLTQLGLSSLLLAAGAALFWPAGYSWLWAATLLSGAGLALALPALVDMCERLLSPVNYRLAAVFLTCGQLTGEMLVPALTGYLHRAISSPGALVRVTSPLLLVGLCSVAAVCALARTCFAPPGSANAASFSSYSSSAGSRRRRYRPAVDDIIDGDVGSGEESDEEFDMTELLRANGGSRGPGGVAQA